MVNEPVKKDSKACPIRFIWLNCKLNMHKGLIEMALDWGWRYMYYVQGLLVIILNIQNPLELGMIFFSWKLTQKPNAKCTQVNSQFPNKGQNRISFLLSTFTSRSWPSWLGGLCLADLACCNCNLQVALMLFYYTTLTAVSLTLSKSWLLISPSHFLSYIITS